MINSKMGRYLVTPLYFCIVFAIPIFTIHALLDNSAEEVTQFCQAVDVVDGRTSYRQCTFPEQSSRITATNASEIHPFLQTHGAWLGITDAQEDLQLLEVKNGLASRHYRYQQQVAGIPVFGGYFSLHEDGNGRVHTIHSNYQANPQLKQARGQLTQTEIENIAIQTLGIMKLRSFGVQSSPVWFPTENGSFSFAYQLSILSELPLGNFKTVVDAQTGAVLFNENRIAHAEGHGYTFSPNPVQTDGDNTDFVDGNDATTPALDAERISVTLKGLNSGTGLLIGEFADVATYNSPTLPDVDANEPSRNYFYDRDDPRFEQVMVYHTIDSIQRYIHSLGFDDDVGVANGIRDYPTLANAHYLAADESYFDPPPGDNAMQFGDGGVDDAEDADIIAHEYGHAIQHAQNSNWGNGHMGAMGEGFGDYLAASFFADEGDPAYQSSDAACVAEWDSYPCLRRVDNNRRYPDDLSGSVHSQGRIWSRALWDIRGAIGREAADTVILEHHFALPNGSTMPDAAEAMLQADADVYGSIHDAAIRAVFCDRGILSGATCSVVVNGYGVELAPASQASVADAGNTVTYTVQITNLGTVADIFDLSFSGNAWTTEIDQSSVSLGVGGSDTAVVTVTIPNDGMGMDVVTLTATSQGNNTRHDTALFSTSVAGTVFYGVDLSLHAAQDGFIGTTVTYTLQITNEGTVADVFALTLSGNSWGSDFDLNSISLGAGEMNTAVVSVTIPNDALVGDMDVVTVTATSQGNNSQQDTAVLTTTVIAGVPGFYDVDISANQATTEDIGSQVTYNYWITNTGNLPDVVYLIVSGNSWITEIDPTFLNLDAGASGVTTMTVNIPLTATQNAQDIATVTATSQGNSSENALATATTTANLPEFGLSLSGNQTVAGGSGETVTYSIQLINIGKNSDSFDIVVSGNSWSTVPDSTSESLAAGAQTTVEVIVTVPENDDVSDTAVVTFTSQGDNQVSKAITLTTNRNTFTYLPLIIKP